LNCDTGRDREFRLVPARETRVEMLVVNSRFIATLAPAFSVDEARAFIDRVRLEFSDASHNVPAFVIGHGDSVIAHCSDDGEPAGTAGRPALAVLQGSGIGDAVVVVTRYFGGTKLGTGGLVRAYGGAVREVLRVTELSAKVPATTLLVAVPYNLYEPLKRLVDAVHGQVLDQTFAADVTLSLRLASERVPQFQADVQELSAGRAEILVVEENPAVLFPLGRHGAELLHL